VHAKVERGVFRENSRWVSYRRNYGSVSIAFALSPPRSVPAARAGELDVYIKDSPDSPYSERVHHFAVRLAAEDERTGRPIDLVQHTSKRDHGPQRAPVKVPVTPLSHMGGHLGLCTDPPYGLPPSSPPLLSSSPSASPPSMSSSPATVARTNLLPPLRLDGTPSYAQYDYPPPGLPSHAVFERIQFRKATANNGKRRTAQQMYRYAAEVYAVTESGSEYLVGRATTDGLVVRGRSPGHYAN
ncbi:uncharacterized protein V1510DRAFT_344945, partial [Dipodascopsis tothii]|uniref:uncharacterized protein n=1 Tax=Dipodascopsis tothii TaxID=44089 RepID=UPI0034CF411B